MTIVIRILTSVQLVVFWVFLFRFWFCKGVTYVGLQCAYFFFSFWKKGLFYLWKEQKVEVLEAYRETPRYLWKLKYLTSTS